MGDDATTWATSSMKSNFYPRPPYGGRPDYVMFKIAALIFLSTSPVWGTTSEEDHQTGMGQISIHVPRMGDDRPGSTVISWPDLFLSTSPVWGTTDPIQGKFDTVSKFLSTSPVWGTTRPAQTATRLQVYFYPRPPYGGRLYEDFANWVEAQISIHVPRMGDDVTALIAAAPQIAFLSTSPVWGTTSTCWPSFPV